MISIQQHILSKSVCLRSLGVLVGFSTTANAYPFQILRGGSKPKILGFSKQDNVSGLIPVSRKSDPLFSSKGEILSQSADNERFPFCPQDEAKEHVLVVGDGDLSYSASIAAEMEANSILLVASVLENQQEHERVYRNSRDHAETISSFESHQVLYQTDATQLHNNFPHNFFKRVEFNFPHWKGKANNRYNRQLLGEFLHSARRLIKDDGEIYVALKEEQGGAQAKDLSEWRLSWVASQLAAEAGLLLKRLDPFEVSVNFKFQRFFQPLTMFSLLV
jgi:hypothetical protein